MPNRTFQPYCARDTFPHHAQSYLSDDRSKREDRNMDGKGGTWLFSRCGVTGSIDEIHAGLVSTARFRKNFIRPHSAQQVHVNRHCAPENSSDDDDPAALIGLCVMLLMATTHQDVLTGCGQPNKLLPEHMRSLLVFRIYHVYVYSAKSSELASITCFV